MKIPEEVHALMEDLSIEINDVINFVPGSDEVADALLTIRALLTQIIACLDKAQPS